MYSEFVVCAFIIFLLLMVDCFRSVNNTTNDPRHLGHFAQSFSSPLTHKGCNRKSGANSRAKSHGPFDRSSDRLCRSAGEPREAYGVRPACWRFRATHRAPKREQAPRTPSASRHSVAALPRWASVVKSSVVKDGLPTVGRLLANEPPAQFRGDDRTRGRSFAPAFA